MNDYFIKPKPLVDMKVKLDLSNFGTKLDLIKATGAYTLNFALTTSFSSPKIGW